VATIVCFGDSNTWGFDPASGQRLPREVRWPGILRRELGVQHEVVEEALNGRTTCWEDPFHEGRNARTYVQTCLWSHAPVDLVVIMVGTNDLKTHFHADAPQIAAGASGLVDLARRSLAGPGGVPPQVVLVAPPPLGPLTDRSELWGFGSGREKSTQLGRLYRIAAEWAGCAFLDAGEVVTTSPLDGVHLEASAHEHLGRAVAQVVTGMLREPDVP
jgi:lysophospholipase L1-like esterase